MKLLFSLFFVLFWAQTYAQTDTVSIDILKWVEVTKTYGYKTTVTFPEIYSSDGILKTKREIGGDVISWVEEVSRLYYQAMKDSAYIYLQRYCSSLDTSEIEDQTYKKVIGDKLFLTFGADLNFQLIQLPAIKPNDQTEIELIHKYLFEYFEAAYFKKDQLDLSVFNENVSAQFPFYNSLYQISQMVK